MTTTPLLVGEDGSLLRRSAFSIATPGARPGSRGDHGDREAGRARSGCAGATRPATCATGSACTARGETDVSRYLGFVYTEAAFAGEASFPPGPGGEPLPPGEYELRLMHDESYVVLAKASFTLLP